MDTFKTLIDNNYSKIKSNVHSVAFRFYIDESDLMSIVNLKLTKEINKEYDEKHFMTFINRLITNAAIDYKRTSHAIHPTEDIDEIEFVGKVYQPDFQLKELLSKICNDLSNNSSVKDVFEGYFLMGIESLDLSERLQMNHETVRTHVFKIRKYVKEKYQNQYKELIS